MRQGRALGEKRNGPLLGSLGHVLQDGPVDVSGQVYGFVLSGQPGNGVAVCWVRQNAPDSHEGLVKIMQVAAEGAASDPFAQKLVLVGNAIGHEDG